MYIMYMNNISWALHLAYYTVDTVELFTKVTRSHRNCFFFVEYSTLVQDFLVM